MRKKGFFKKLAESMKRFREEEPTYEEYPQDEEGVVNLSIRSEGEDEYEEEEEVGELAIDMYRTHNAIVVRTMIAGTRKSDIEINLTRDSLTIEGTRQAPETGEVYETYFEELYWGPFAREIELPEEIDIEAAEAHEEHGLLTITLPLIDRHKRTRLKIK